MAFPEEKLLVPTENGLGKGKRPAACIHCHQRKVRCDARNVGIPCSNCRTAGKLDCRIHEKKKRTVVRSAQHPVPIRCAPHPSSGTANISPMYKFEAEAKRDGYSEHTSPEAQTDHEDNKELNRHLVQLIDEDLNHRSIQRDVRVMYVGQDVSNLNFLLREQRKDQDEVYHFAANAISSQYMRQCYDLVPREAFILPDQTLADDLVAAYFSLVNPGFPLIDEDSFMSQYRSRDPQNAPSLLLLQAILLVGAHVSRQRPDRDTLKSTFFRKAKMLFEARVERNRDYLVQAALLLTWYSDPIDDDVASNAHYWVGIAARIATGLGMHRNAGSSTLVPNDKRMWRRTWWVLVQFDVMISLQYGRPQAINLDDCDVEPLVPADFEGCGSRVQPDYVIQFTELCCMISVIMRERFGLRVTPERRKAALLEADAALAKWSLMLPESVRMSTDVTDSWPALLHLTYNNFLILLHRPNPKASAYSEDYGPHDAEICSAAAGVILSIFEDLREKDRIKCLWLSSVNALFTAMIQIRVELRFSNPVLAMNALRRFDSTLVSLGALAEYWLSAETILRLFQSSKRLQQDLEMVKMRQDTGRVGESLNQGQTNPASLSSETHGSQGGTPNWWPRHDSEREPDQTPGTVVNDPMDKGIEHGDWRQLFSFGDSDPFGTFMPDNLTDMEDEWRQIYLHEPGVADYFHESIWPQT